MRPNIYINFVNLNWYSISFFKLHISARVSMHKADELAGIIRSYFISIRQASQMKFVFPIILYYKNTQSSIESVHMHFVS